jgi:hypothetical protein
LARVRIVFALGVSNSAGNDAESNKNNCAHHAVAVHHPANLLLRIKPRSRHAANIDEVAETVDSLVEKDFAQARGSGRLISAAIFRASQVVVSKSRIRQKRAAGLGSVRGVALGHEKRVTWTRFDSNSSAKFPKSGLEDWLQSPRYAAQNHKK